MVHLHISSLIFELSLHLTKLFFKCYFFSEFLEQTFPPDLSFARTLMKAWKLQECVAHSPGSVTSVSLGRKSGRVMATGGEDRRVKLWAVGKPSCILSLSGHTSSVEATEFGQSEDRVAAGSLSGSIRIWDLEQVKIVRALSGHTSSIRTLDFHPHGNFVASGSLDTLVKLWDVSRKGCINTYRGHACAVNMIRFSPDGNWIVSAGDDGVIKLWDLSAGRQLSELVGHTGPVTNVAFHPTVLLLATASTDRTVRLFDLENFTQIAMSGTELTGSTIRRIAFHPNGSCLYVATSDYLRIYHYETMKCLETVHVGWRTAGGLDDMAVAPSVNQLVGVSISNSLISTYVVDIKSCVPFVQNSPIDENGDEETGSSEQIPNLVNYPNEQTGYDRLTVENPTSVIQPTTTSRPFTRCGSSTKEMQSRNRKSFCLTSERSQHNVMQEDPTDPDACLPYNPSTDDQPESTNFADINDPDEYDRVFKPNRTVPRSPPRTGSLPSQDVPPHISRVLNPPKPCANPPNPTEPLLLPKLPISSHALPDVVSVEKPFTPPQIQIKKSVSQSSVPKAAYPSQNFTNENDSIAVEDFLPRPPQKPCDPLNPHLENALKIGQSFTDDEPSEAELLLRIRKPHDSFMMALMSRAKGLSTVRGMWTADNIRTAMDSVLVMNDPAILVDILGILAQNSKLWSLDLVNTLLPHLVTLVKSKYNTHVETACQAVCVIIKNFAQLIRRTLESPAPPGVDLVREERCRKCQDCMSHLLAFRSALTSKEVSSKAGQVGRELGVIFEVLV